MKRAKLKACTQSTNIKSTKPSKTTKAKSSVSLTASALEKTARYFTTSEPKAKSTKSSPKTQKPKKAASPKKPASKAKPAKESNYKIVETPVTHITTATDFIKQLTQSIHYFYNNTQLDPSLVDYSITADTFGARTLRLVFAQGMEPTPEGMRPTKPSFTFQVSIP